MPLIEKPYLAPLETDECTRAWQLHHGPWSGRLMRVIVRDAHDTRWGTIEGLVFLVLSEPQLRYSSWCDDNVEQVMVWARGTRRWWTKSFVSYQQDLSVHEETR